MESWFQLCISIKVLLSKSIKPLLNSVASANTLACCGVSERMPNYCSLRIEDSPQLTPESFKYGIYALIYRSRFHFITNLKQIIY
jgi:hypothetical protein